MLKFLLEAHDNLAYLSTVSPHTAVVKLVFAPGQEAEVRDFLETIRCRMVFHEVVMVPGEPAQDNESPAFNGLHYGSRNGGMECETSSVTHG